MTPLMLVTMAWVVGILTAQAVSVPAIWSLLPVPFALAVALGWWDSRRARRATAMLIALAAGLARVWFTQPQFGAGHVLHYVATGPLEVEGVVVEAPDRRAGGTRLEVDGVSLAGADVAPIEVDGRVLVIVPPFTDVAYGDRIRVQAALRLPQVYKDFSYRKYLARQGIYALLRADDLEVLASGQANPVVDTLIQFRERAYGVAVQLLPAPQGALLAGMLLGVEDGLPGSLVSAFARTGTTHIVAISGYNLTLVSLVVIQGLRYILKRRGQFLVSLVVIWAYVVMVGASPPVVRAGVMSSLLALAHLSGRKVHGPTALAVATLTMSAHDPGVLWDLGFRLSLAAVAAYVVYVPLVTGWLAGPLEKLIDRFGGEAAVTWLSNALVLNLAVQLTTLGLTAIVSGELSLVAPLANLLVLPAQSSVMLFGGVALVLALISLPLGVVVGWFGWVFLAYTTQVVSLLAALPWATLPLEGAGPAVVLGYYAVLAAGTVWAMAAPEARQRATGFVRGLDWRLRATAVAVIVLVLGALVMVPDGRLHVVFLDAGSGDAVFIRTPSGRQALIDGGADGPRTRAAVSAQMPFWDRDLDLVVLTSPDQDRLPGLVPVVAEMPVAHVVNGAEVGEGAAYGAWRETLDARSEGANAIVSAGEVLALDDDVALEVLWPPAGVEGPLVLRVTYGRTGVLLMGGATTIVEEALVDVYGQALQSDVMQLARRGAEGSTTAALLQAVIPEAAVVSLEQGRTPSPYIGARLMDIPLYHTGSDGAVDVVSDGQTIDIRTGR